jgi:hypothetical protein
MTSKIKLNPVISFADMSLKVAAVRAAGNSNFEFEFPASGPQTTPSALSFPLALFAQNRRDPFSDAQAWHHGGLNE